MLTFLHLSDLHITTEDAGSQFYQDVKIRQAILDDLGIEGRTNLDAILVTGDVAYHGRADEFERAKLWFEEVRTKTNSDPEAFFVVPGNHDVNQAIVFKSSGLWDLHEALRNPKKSTAERLASLECKLKDPTMPFLAALKEYNAFASEYGCPTTCHELAWVQFLNGGKTLEDGTVGHKQGCPHLLADTATPSEASAEATAAAPIQPATPEPYRFHSGEKLTDVEASRMMSAVPVTVVLCAGPQWAGKTTFLARVGEMFRNGSFKAFRFAGSKTLCAFERVTWLDHADDRAYLEPLRGQWLRGEKLEHTSRLAPAPPHQLLVRQPASGIHATFHIPDLAGEKFDSQFVTRSLPNEFGLRVQRATGLILFLHCGHQADHDLLEHPQFIDAESTTEAPAIKPVQAADWSIERASKQVKLVDLLQFVAELREVPLRVAVAISAWDLVEQAPTGLLPKEPSLFFSKQWPLLAQYLESNRDAFPFRTFGVSARGGGTSAEEIKRLTKLVHPRDRVILVDGDHRSNDLTRPVRWLLGMLDTPDSSNG